MKDADAVRNLKNIIEKENRKELMLVISAMGKTTNAIEKILAEFRKNNGHLEISALSEIIVGAFVIFPGYIAPAAQNADFAEIVGFSYLCIQHYGSIFFVIFVLVKVFHVSGDSVDIHGRHICRLVKP